MVVIFTNIYPAERKAKPGCSISPSRGHPTPMTETDMATLSIKTMMAALLAGSIAATAGGLAYAKTDGQAFDPGKFQQRIEKRVDKALTGTDATADQKKKVSDILQGAFTSMKPLRDQRVENRKAMEAAMQAPTLDPAKIEQIRAEQMKVADQSSKV